MCCLEGSPAGLPFILAGALKFAYDLTLWSIFRQVLLKEETPWGARI